LSQHGNAIASLVDLTKRLLALVEAPDRDRSPQSEMVLVDAIRAVGAQLAQAGQTSNHPILLGNLSGSDLAAWLRRQPVAQPGDAASAGERRSRR
jgi:hypothetical protein